VTRVESSHCLESRHHCVFITNSRTILGAQGRLATLAGTENKLWVSIDGPGGFLLAPDGPDWKIAGPCWLYLISIHIRLRHWLNTQQTGSAYKSASGSSFLKTYSSVACNMTLIHLVCSKLYYAWYKRSKPKPNHFKPKLQT